MGNCCCKEEKPIIEFDNNQIECVSECCMRRKSPEREKLSPRFKRKNISSNSV